VAVPRRKKGYLYPPPLKSDRYSHLHRLKPASRPAKAGQTGYFRAKRRTKIRTEIERQPRPNLAKASLQTG
jgi:hypothetical protein